MLTFAAMIRSAMRQEVLRILQVVGEDRRVFGPADHAVLQGNCFVERVERNQVEDRAEGFVLDDFPFIFDNRDCRSDEVTRPIDALATTEDFAAFFAYGFARGLNGSYSGVVDQRAHQGVGIQRIADTHLAVGFDQGVFDLIKARTVCDYAASRRTPLSSRADCAEHDRWNGKIQVGVFRLR